MCGAILICSRSDLNALISIIPPSHPLLQHAPQASAWVSDCQATRVPFPLQRSFVTISHIRFGRLRVLQSSRPGLQCQKLFNQRVRSLHYSPPPPFLPLWSSPALAKFVFSLNFVHTPLFRRYFIISAVWLVIAVVALVLIHRPKLSPDSSDRAFCFRSDAVSPIPTTQDASVYTEFQPSATSFTPRSFDPMHKYCVVLIILSSGFWQYFIQGLIAQLALGPLLSSEYQNHLFWIQQCHLTIGAAHNPPIIRFLTMFPQAPFSAGARATHALWSPACSDIGCVIAKQPQCIEV